MKRIICLLTALLLLMPLCACGEREAPAPETEATTTAAPATETTIATTEPATTTEAPETEAATIAAIASTALPATKKTSKTTSKKSSPQTEPQTEDALFVKFKAPARDYKEVVERFREMFHQDEGRFYADCHLYDMDGDNVKELFIKFGTCEADYHWFVYTTKNGKAICIGDFGGSHSYLIGCATGGVYLSYGHMGWYGITKYTKQGDKLKETVVIEYHEFSDDDYEEWNQPDKVDLPLIDIDKIDKYLS